MTTTEHRFTVDARLLRELGERLVGQPHIALGELVKNAYDADARLVEIAIEGGRIVVTDDGHGMSPHDFVDKWMRVGTTHKEQERRSPALHRTMTGSKGVGRLAVQVLARTTRITTVALSFPSRNLQKSDMRGKGILEEQVDAKIQWDRAIESGDLTAVTIPVEVGEPVQKFAGNSSHGTRVELTDLVHRWDSDRFRQLAQEIWSLQPPFTVDDDDPNAFRIVLTTGYRSVYERFNEQMSAILDIWNARVTGSLLPVGNGEASNTFDLPKRLAEPGPNDPYRADDSDPSELGQNETDGTTSLDIRPDRLLEVSIQIRDRAPRTLTWRVPHCEIDQLDFDIRVFDLVNRQPRNIKVGVAREYLSRFGGISVYDGGFRLPYYGTEHDWLDIEKAHAARLSVSHLLPDSLKVDRGLQDLPTTRRLFGRVSISTSHEAASYRELGLPDTEALGLQVTRDRLTDNAAYERLRVMVRAALDAYAMEQARTRLMKARAKRPGATQRPATAFRDVQAAIQAARPALSATTYRELDRAATRAVQEAEALEEVSREHAALLGALATAGMTAIAYEHEISKQIAMIRGLASDLEAILGEVPGPAGDTLATAIQDMRSWVDRAKGIRSLLAPLMDEESRTARDRFSALNVAKQVSTQVAVLGRGIPVSVEAIPKSLRLPEGPLPAWTAILQNLYINAFNALVETISPRVDVDAGGDDANGWIRVQDNGAGVDLSDSARLWEPFERGRALPPELAALGLGGTGLGLTIVRMIAEELGVTASFAKPDSEHRTAVVINWSGK